MINRAVIIPAAASLAAVVCTSVIWIGAYYIGVKDDGNDRIILVPNDNSSYPSGSEPEITKCLSSCEFQLIESIPTNLSYTEEIQFISTTSAWLKLIMLANSTIDIASYYWSLKPEDSGGYYDETAQNGINIFNGLVDAAKNRNIKLRITQNAQLNNETAYLSQNDLAMVRSLNFTEFLGAGILHTKAWSVDGKHLYIGSANLDWRSLTQVKELGVAIYDCPCLAQDLNKMMQVYWEMGAPKTQLPTKWPASLSTVFNKNNPMSVRLNDQQSAVYFSSAPLELCPDGRENDINAILQVINTAQQFIHIAVMDYVPAILYAPNNKNRYWDVIDTALRTAAYRNVNVKLMTSRWAHTRKSSYSFLRSLADINNGLPCQTKYNATTGTTQCIPKGSIEVRLFEVPAYGNQSQILFARVNHNKYMVTDNAAYIGTSNWSGDYFLSTGGFGITIRSDDIMQTSTIVTDVNKIFLRDWNSIYARSIYDFDNNGNPVTGK